MSLSAIVSISPFAVSENRFLGIRAAGCFAYCTQHLSMFQNIASQPVNAEYVRLTASTALYFKANLSRVDLRYNEGSDLFCQLQNLLFRKRPYGDQPEAAHPDTFFTGLLNWPLGGPR